MRLKKPNNKKVVLFIKMIMAENMVSLHDKRERESREANRDKCFAFILHKKLIMGILCNPVAVQ